MPGRPPDEVVHELLDRALELPPDARLAFLDQACAGNQTLRQRLLRLLSLAERDDGFLDAPALAPVSPSADEPSQIGEGVHPGQHLGAYALVRRLGSGGMGEVWLGERIEGGFRQQVAIKRIRSEHGSASSRFHVEQEILASLEHPGIARLYDGGLDHDGQPYMVMEYVDGEHLLHWCDSHDAGLEQRLNLFLQICDAVAYAHANLVVHRDLKPANILVREDGRTKLLDFGIAKLVQAIDPGDATRTMHLSPAYAAPEQLSGERVGTATDVYALGVVLYELLTGRTPWRTNGLSLATAMQRILDTTSPVAPSRVATADGLVPARTLRGDLDAIVNKALRRQPAARYPDARALADDVRRHLRREPVLARSGARWYVARRFMRRHWLPLTAATALFVALIGGLVGIAWQAQRAEQQAQRALAVQGFLTELFAAAGPSARHGPDASARDVLNAGLERLNQDQRLEPQVRADLLLIIGRSLNALSLVHEARTAFELASDQQQLYPAQFSERAKLRLLMARNAKDRGELDLAAMLADALLEDIEAHGLRDATVFNLHVLRAGLRVLVFEHAQALETLQPALDLLAEDRIAIEPSDEAAAWLIAGICYSKALQPQAAIAAVERALALYRSIDLEHPALGDALGRLAIVYQDQADFPRARAIHEQAIEQLTRVYGADSLELGLARNNYAGLLLRAGDHHAAIGQLRESLQIHERLAIDDPSTIGFRRYLLALALIDVRNDEEAREQLGQALALIERSEDPGISTRIRYLFAVLDCRAQRTESLPRLQALLPDLDQDSRGWYMRGRIYYADCLEVEGQSALAHAEYSALRDLVEQYRDRISPADHIHTELREGLARTSGD